MVINLAFKFVSAKYKRKGPLRKTLVLKRIATLFFVAPGLFRKQTHKIFLIIIKKDKYLAKFSYDQKFSEYKKSV